jgi:threonine/homoserine/homoserine lactone efflux protein
MSKYIKLFTAAFSISFFGALPIGTLNTSVANYALNNNFKGAIQFGIAAILVEVILVRIALIVLGRLIRLKKLFKILCAGMCFGILILAFKTLEAAFHMHNFQDVLPFVGKNAFSSGLVLSLLNPLHLPFWMGWTAVLENKKILVSSTRTYNIYIIAIGAGTTVAFTIYALVGNLLIDALKAQHNFINWIFGGTLLFTGLVLAYKLISGQIYLKERLSPVHEVE